MIDVEDLTVRYPGSDRDAIAGIHLAIPAGEVFGVIGPNGAGKTSLLRVLAGLQAATSGHARVAGIDVTKHPAQVRRRVGWLPDFFGVYDDLTCREYLEFFAAAQGVPRARREAIVEEVLALVDLSAKTEAMAGSLSRGMQQRLGLARVLVHEPAVLLLDEPASGLDPRARIEVREILRELGAMGRTVILSSHVLTDLSAACSSVAIIEQGRLAYSGTVREAMIRGAASDCAVMLACDEGPEAMRQALAAAADLDPGLDVEDHADGLRVSTRLPEGADAERQRALLAAACSAALVRAGLRLTHVAIERPDLERAFMTLTAGHLA